MEALAGPSFGDDPEAGIRVNAEFVGSITGSSLFQELPDAKSDSPGVSTGYSVSGHCTFAGVLTPSNRLNVAYGGFVTATGPQVPQLTDVKCEISNLLAETDSIEVASGGPVSTAADQVAGWRVSPIQVCVSGFAVYGPTPVVVVQLPRTCGGCMTVTHEPVEEKVCT